MRPAEAEGALAFPPYQPAGPVQDGSVQMPGNPQAALAPLGTRSRVARFCSQMTACCVLLPRFSHAPLCFSRHGDDLHDRVYGNSRLDYGVTGAASARLLSNGQNDHASRPSALPRGCSRRRRVITPTNWPCRLRSRRPKRGRASVTRWAKSIYGRRWHFVSLAIINDRQGPAAVLAAFDKARAAITRVMVGSHPTNRNSLP